MKFSYGEVHVWTQYALCLISLGRHVHAFSVLQVVIKLAPQKVMPCLLAARLCYEHLNRVITILCSHDILFPSSINKQDFKFCR